MNKGANKMNTYNIRTKDAAPYMTESRVVVQAGSYADAVAMARKSFLETGRTTYLCSGEYGMQVWHQITGYDRVAIDKNRGSGIQEREVLA
jgi:hypothetical protein